MVFSPPSSCVCASAESLHALIGTQNQQVYASEVPNNAASVPIAYPPATAGGYPAGLNNAYSTPAVVVQGPVVGQGGPTGVQQRQPAVYHEDCFGDQTGFNIQWLLFILGFFFWIPSVVGCFLPLCQVR